MTSGLDTPHDEAPLLDHGLADLAERYDLVLCDVWGVIHNGVAHHPAAVDALQRYRRGGGTVVLITNAPALARNVVARLDSLAVPRDAYDAVATSGDVTVAMIVEAGCPPLFNIGPDREIDLYYEARRLGLRKPTLVGVEQAELVIAISPADHIGHRLEDYDVLLQIMLARKLVMICANPDIVVEVGDTLEYCAGAIAERYEAIGGAVIQAGKPFPPIYERALGLARDRIGDVPTSRILAIGDAMHTDMQGAQNQGIDALFITSGIHRAELHGATRGTPLDQAALRQFLTSRDAKPVAALAMLAWSV
jgi:HAD superfamily hydrolase (TIGR01459 family)